MNTLRKHTSTRHLYNIEPNNLNNKKVQKKNSYRDSSVSTMCKKECKKRLILFEHFKEIHLDYETESHHQNLDTIIVMYEANLEDSD